MREQAFVLTSNKLLLKCVVPDDLLEKRKKSIFAGLPAALPKPGVPIIQINKPNSNENSEGSEGDSSSSGSSQPTEENKEQK